jgi:hypothetical protein
LAQPLCLIVGSSGEVNGPKEEADAPVGRDSAHR